MPLESSADARRRTRPVGLTSTESPCPGSVRSTVGFSTSAAQAAVTVTVSDRPSVPRASTARTWRE